MAVNRSKLGVGAIRQPPDGFFTKTIRGQQHDIFFSPEIAAARKKLPANRRVPVPPFLQKKIAADAAAAGSGKKALSGFLPRSGRRFRSRSPLIKRPKARLLKG